MGGTGVRHGYPVVMRIGAVATTVPGDCGTAGGGICAGGGGAPQTIGAVGAGCGTVAVVGGGVEICCTIGVAVGAGVGSVETMVPADAGTAVAVVGVAAGTASELNHAEIVGQFV